MEAEVTKTRSAFVNEFSAPRSTSVHGKATLYWRALIVIVGLAVYLWYRVHTPACNMLSTNDNTFSSTDSIFIPFIYDFSTNHVPQVMCIVDGVSIEMPIDTGSTGTLIGASILPNVSSTAGTPAHHFFTSSKILYVGRLVDLSMDFVGEAGSYATANLPVLIVDKSWKCPWYDPSKDSFGCPGGPNGESATERNTSNITYMGVGFGRNRPKDGMPYATPSINPLLNIVGIDGVPVSEASMRAGYIVSTAGLYLGLTPANTRGFAFTDLEPGLTHAGDKRDWAMASMCFTINGVGSHCGPVLVDTGIAQMYIRAEEGVSIPTIVIPNPNPNGHAKMVKRVKPGTKIAIGCSDLERPAVLYSFVVGDGSSVEPSYVFPQVPTSPPFVNTGRHLLFGYSVAFDAEEGRVGFRATEVFGSSSES